MALFSDEQRTAMREAGNRFALLFRLATPNPVRIWSGPGELPVPSDPVVEKTDGALYRGLGALPDLPTLESLFNGTASRIELSLSAPDEDGRLAALAESEAVSARNRQAVFGLWPLDKGWQPVGAVRWIRRGVSHGVSVNQDGSDPTPEKPGRDTNKGTDQDRRPVCDNPDDQRCLCPIHKTGQQITAQQIGSQQELPAGRHRRTFDGQAVKHLVLRIIWRDPRRKQG